MRPIVLATALLLAPAAGGAEPAAEAVLRHDPFRQIEALSRPPPPPKAPPAAPRPPWQPQLRALVFAGGRSVADIDGTLYRLGDRFEDHRVAAIDRDSVYLVGVHDGHRHRLRLASGQGSTR